MKVDIENCVACNKCITHCPTNANYAHFDEDNNIKISIVENDCIHCGECIKVCDHKSRYFEDDTERFFRDLEYNQKRAIIAAPAVLYNFKDYKNLIGWFKSLGVEFIYDISFGADITTWAYLKAYNDPNIKSLISQPCPVIVNYIERFIPSLIENLAPVHSPTLCTAIYLKKYKNYEGKIAMLSPCIGKKSEFEDPNTKDFVRYNVTITKLKEYIQKNNIRLNDFPAQDFDNIHSNLGFTYSRPGGLKENVDFYTNSSVWVKQIEGTNHALHYLSEYDSRKKTEKLVPQLVDILNCLKGCNCGTATDDDISTDDIDYETNELKQKFLNSEQASMNSEENKNHQTPLFAMFEEQLDFNDFKRLYTDKSSLVNKEASKEEDIEKVFVILGKTTEKERNHNCGACGHGKCYKFVNSVVRGRAVVDSCFYYAKSVLHNEFSAIKIVRDENLKRTQHELRKIENNQIELNNVVRSINLISINASIEAASAGAYGKGFSVVAQEIKKLADQSENIMTATVKNNKEIRKQLDGLKSSLDKLLKK